jgi:DNA-binding NarL/FixJ family response regulator
MMTTRPRIILADDHRIITESLTPLLSIHFDVAATVGSGLELVKAAEQIQPDAAIIDISMPIMNGFEAARQMRQKSPQTKIVCLSMHSERAYVDEALAAGISGYVLKRAAVSELVSAVRQVLNGITYISPLIPAAAPDSPNGLTQRQREVLRHVAEGRSAKDIATALAISPKTVEFHKAAIMDKLGLHSSAQLMRYAFDHGIARN